MIGAMILTASAAVPQTASVTACVDVGADLGGPLWRAEAVASKMFASAGVRVDWHFGSSSCPEDGIIIRRRDKTPADLRPSALAYALPYQGSSIEVFMDRIEQVPDKRLTPVL